MDDTRIIEGSDRPPPGARFGVIVSRFNPEVVENLLNGCLDALRSRGVPGSNVVIVRVPGAFEIPVVARRLAENGDCDALIALGAVIRGETPHFDYVAGECARGIAEVAADLGLPIAFGVLTTDTEEQAIARAGGDQGNKGADAALTAIEMLNVLRLLKA
jgi:6,7-dimethyl-8-ribityllumazine synthase